MRTGADSIASPSFVELQRELPAYSPRAWRFGAMAAASRAGALLSQGLRIGHRHGFDSGPFMAHVYDNHPRGRTPVGRAIDRRLLARRTCQAFREIRELARRSIDAAISADRSGAPVIADLAAGPAPYLFEALVAHPGATAIVVDIDQAALAQAREAAARAGVLDRAQFLQGSAFDRDVLAKLAPTPTIIVELGLYGIYHDDALIERHFRDLAEIVEPEQLVFNVQTQNPEIERIARVWRDHRGQRCVWRLRPVDRILEWAAAAGFQPLSIESDSNAIYRVGRLGRTDEVSA
jgi:SAM-dependent methyltransferase